jgi:hypothetical protein
MPFKAVLDGRRDMSDIIVETPWLCNFPAEFLAGIFIEKNGLQFLQE